MAAMWSYRAKWSPIFLFLLENEKASIPYWLPGQEHRHKLRRLFPSPFFNISDRTGDTYFFTHKIFPVLRMQHFLCVAFVWPYPTHTHAASSQFSPTLTTRGIGGPLAKQTRAPLRWVFLPESAFLETEEWHLLLHCSTPKDASDTWPWVQDNLLLAVHHLGH